MDDSKKPDFSRRDFMSLAAMATAALAFDWSGLKALAAKVEPKDKLPVVVIGGGLGGLSAAAILARHGFPVTLVEQHELPGGYATTFDRLAGRYTFDVSLHATLTTKGGPLRQAFEEAGVLDKVEMVELPELARIITPEQDLTWPQRNPQAIIDQLCQAYPAEAEGIKGFFGQMFGVFDEAMKPFDPESWVDRILFPLTHRKMWAVRNQTLADILNQYTQDPKVRSLLSAYCGYYGLPASQLSGFLYCVATAGMMRHGTYYVKRRSQDLSYALLEAIEAAGGEVLLETEAVGIEMKDGAVAGVTLKDGRRLAAKAIISNSSAPATMAMLPQGAAGSEDPQKAEKYLDRIRTARPSISTFIVWLGLNQEIRDKIKGYEISVEEDSDPEGWYEAALACDPVRSGIGVAIYDNAYPGYSLPGTSTVTVMMLSGYEPWQRFEADYEAGRKSAYYQEKERITKALIAKAERLVIPNLSSMIEVVESATPLTNRRYTKNPQGAIYGYEQSLANTYMNQLGNRTPFKGLYLASAWSNGGGYYPTIMAGLEAFKALIKDWEKKPWG